MDNKEELVYETKAFFDSGFNCCQAVFAPFAMKQGLPEETSLKLTSCFAAGISYNGDTCGAVIGAHMVIGLLNGYNEPGDINRKETVKNLVAIYRKEFINKHGTVKCKELLGKNPAIQKEFNFLKENGIFESKCPGFVSDSTKILIDLLEN